MKRFAKTVVLIFGAIFIISGLLYFLLMELTHFRPPGVSIPPVHEFRALKGKTILSIGNEDRRKSYDAWLARREKLWEMHLSGNPVELGMAHSLLGSFLIREQEAYFIGELERLIPSRWMQRMLKVYVRWHYRWLDRQLPEPLKEELQAMALTYPDPYAHLEDTYQRLVYLHAFHDITQRLERSPLIGCSAFGVWGSYTEDGHLIIGRNFDFEEGKIFDSNKAVLIFRPMEGIPFVSIAWAGMAGAVTGLNAEGIFISVNAARSRETSNKGLPVAFILRRVLQEARTLDEALSILREVPAMVADIFLLGDGRARKAVVVEKTPYRMDVRNEEGLVVATNHFLNDPLCRDPENIRVLRTTSTLHRYQRMEELLKRSEGRIDLGVALEILRDRRGVGDTDLAPGNKNGLNALLACHSVLVDATVGLIWVSEAPNLLGGYRCFDLKQALMDPEKGGRRPSLDLPEDSFLTSGQYDRYLLFSRYLEMARALANKELTNEAFDYARRALSLWPNHPEANLIAGQISQKRHNYKEANHFLRRYLQAHPANPSKAETIRNSLEGNS